LNQAGGFLLTGRVEPDRPRLLVYNLAKSDTLRGCTLIPDFGIRPSLLYLSRSRRQLGWFREMPLAIDVSRQSACLVSSHFESFLNEVAL
jgi:hypothetical protein